MDLFSSFVLYLLLFRLAIIAAGIISIVLGYRLFCRAVWPSIDDHTATSVRAEFVGSRFTVKHAAPGTCFALFGALIIGILLATSTPQLTLNMLKAAGQTGLGSDGSYREKTAFEIKGSERDALNVATQKGVFFEERNDTSKAIAAYEDAVNLISEPMNNLAWLYLGKGRTNEALPLAKMATQLSPDNANYLDTLAETLYENGSYSEALAHLEKAARLDLQYKQKLAKFREAAK